jgi:hypothetical protein
MLKIESAVAMAVEHFELVVQAFDKARGLQVNEGTGEFVPIAM